MTQRSPAAVDPEAVRAIVAEVLRRIHGGRSPADIQTGVPRGAGLQPATGGAGRQGGTGAAAGSGRLQVRPTAAGEMSIPADGASLSGRVISLGMLEKLPAGVARVSVEAAAVITPSARDHARDKGIAIERVSAAAGQPAATRVPFLVAHAECSGDASARTAAIARAVPGAAQLPASGLADVVATLALHASRDAARGILLTTKPALATVLANRSASLRAVTARDPATLAAAAAECNANLLVVDRPLPSPPAPPAAAAKDIEMAPAPRVMSHRRRRRLFGMADTFRGQDARGYSTMRIREGLPVPAERRCRPSAARMAERGQHRASGGQDARSERPTRRHGQPRATRDVASMLLNGTSPERGDT